MEDAIWCSTARFLKCQLRKLRGVCVSGQYVNRDVFPPTILFKIGLVPFFVQPLSLFGDLVWAVEDFGIVCHDRYSCYCSAKHGRA